MRGSREVVMSQVKVVVAAVTKYGGLKALGAILSSRKGVFGIVAIGLCWYLLLGRLAADVPEDVLVKMSEIFGMLVGVISGLFIGGTALEDSLKKGAKNTNSPKWVKALAQAAGESYTDYSDDGDVDMVAIVKAIINKEISWQSAMKQGEAKSAKPRPEEG